MRRVCRVYDCQAVFVAKIGNGPTEKLNARGIDAVSEYACEEKEMIKLVERRTGELEKR